MIGEILQTPRCVWGQPGRAMLLKVSMQRTRKGWKEMDSDYTICGVRLGGRGAVVLAAMTPLSCAERLSEADPANLHEYVQQKNRNGCCEIFMPFLCVYRFSISSIVKPVAWQICSYSSPSCLRFFAISRFSCAAPCL